MPTEDSFRREGLWFVFWTSPRSRRTEFSSFKVPAAAHHKLMSACEGFLHIDHALVIKVSDPLMAASGREVLPTRRVTAGRPESASAACADLPSFSLSDQSEVPLGVAVCQVT